MTTKGALSWCWLVGALVVAASCAQGSADNAVDGGGTVAPGDAGGQSNVEGGADTGATNPVGNDSAPPDPGNDSGPPSDDSGAAGPDAADAGEDSGPSGKDAGKDSGGGTDAGPVIPTDCSQAYQTYGCCAGNVLYYCLTPTSTLTTRACTSGKVCGWDSAGPFYNCVSPPATSGAGHPIVCK